jgi:hypothetical protein
MSEQAAPQKYENVWAFVRPAVLKVIIGAVVAAALVGVVAIIFGTFGTIYLQAFLTIAVIVVFALLAWYDADVSSKRSSTFALIGVCISLYLLAIGMLKIWLPSTNTTNYPADQGYVDFDRSGEIITHFGHWIWLVVIARVALLHAHLLLNIHRRYNTPILRGVANVTMGLIVLFGIMLSLPTIFDSVDFGEAYWRTFGAVLVLDVLGTVLIPLSYALFSPKDANGHRQYGGNGDVPRYSAPYREPAQQNIQSWKHDAEGVRFERPAAPQEPAIDVAKLVHEQDVQHPVGTGAVVFEPAPIRSRKLAWPRYADGTPLPSNLDGTPDFSLVERF